MHVECTAVTISWIPSESIAGLLRRGFDVGLAHYDDPPTDRIAGADDVRRQRDDDRFRFANVLHAWAEVRDGRVVDHGFAADSGLVMGSTTVRVAGLGATFRASSLPVLRPDPVVGPDSVRLVQTVGGRTGVPLPRPVPHPPFVVWQAPVVWTTLAVTLHADGRTEADLAGASAFPRHWLYGPDGRLEAKTGLTDQAAWVAHSFGPRTPWGDQDSPALVVAAESDLERSLSEIVMHGAERPQVRRHPAGSLLLAQGTPGEELLLLLDGVVAVEVDGRRIAEVGPGAVLGERALLEHGLRTSSLVAVTPVRVAAVPGTAVDRDRLEALARGHHREDADPPAPP